jgi:hypothetical protein
MLAEKYREAHYHRKRAQNRRKSPLFGRKWGHFERKRLPECTAALRALPITDKPNGAQFSTEPQS